VAHYRVGARCASASGFARDARKSSDALAAGVFAEDASFGWGELAAWRLAACA
jgi:hypothetical protein